MYTLLDPGAVTIRAVTIQTLFADSSWTDPTTASPSHLRDWVCRVWSDTAFADAVTLASPSLADRVHRVCSAAPLPDHRLRRVATSLTRYLLRARSRPTPNGLFAGVAPVLVGSRTRVRWGGDHHAIARPDASWLTALADHLLDQDHDVPVVTATTAQVRGERLLSPWQPGDSSPVEAAPVSVRHTTAVAMALETARIPRSLSEIASTLATTFPTAAPEAITAMLSQLGASSAPGQCRAPADECRRSSRLPPDPPARPRPRIQAASQRPRPAGAPQPVHYRSSGTATTPPQRDSAPARRILLPDAVGR